jgi:cyclic beta-1,2-glucan synthetase
VEWSLGSSRSRAQQHVVTWFDAEDDMLTAHNHYNLDFPGRATFLASDRSIDSYTADRTEFLGRNGEPSAPAALGRASLGAQTGRFHDACGAITVKVSLDPGQTAAVSFLLGQTSELEEARQLVDDLRRRGAVEEALSATRAMWDETLGAVQVRTPEPELDALVNDWLLYQSLSCRLWGRTALYQSSGAYGFRDQLQDALAFALVRPELLREQILAAAHHQFPEGDVQHWWMPVSGRGVRTRISDDRHWLPYCTAAYVEATGDTAILDERVPFVEGRRLEEGEDDIYLEPSVSERTASLYEHCVAALETARPSGDRGLPLIGGGDWNDGMNRVGSEGRGESVWLAWFLDVTLRRFADVCDERGDGERATDYRGWAAELVKAIEGEAWDGAWYRRAFFDDGTPLGTTEAQECRIDAIAQAWAAISGEGDPERAATALDSVDEHLVDDEARLVKLLTPPFDRMPHDPGYIKGYVPGVRENGGQYTHGVLWIALARLLRGDAGRAVELLRLLCPLLHADTAEGADTYKVEPYVVAADVYAARDHVGRGGWTWYTGSAAWFHRIVVEHLLGIAVVAVDGERHLSVRPCVPPDWPGFTARVRLDGTFFDVEVDNSEGDGRCVDRVLLDGEVVPEPVFRAVTEGTSRSVRVVLGRMG